MLKHIMGSNLSELEKIFNSLENVELVSINILGMNFIIHFREKKNGKDLERKRLKSI